ncbi:MAG: alpha,alpha-trehalose-phosphate synthase (UDP-forming), partial [Kiloniellales bacterium]
MTRLVVVSNRVTPIDAGKGGAIGGLAVAVQDALKETGGVWFGWSGEVTSETSSTPRIVESGSVVYATIDLGERDHEEYYTGFANSVLWPLFHNRLDLTDYSRRNMAGYHRVNSIFAERLLPLLRPDDLVWVHDYHFMPLARNLRELGCRNRLGFFLHIPWPPPDLLLTLPNHERLAEQLADYDLIGFQTARDQHTFETYLLEEAGGRRIAPGVISAFQRTMHSGVYPISIETEIVAQAAAKAAISQQGERFKASLLARKLIIGVDRLDYTKGIVQRLEAYEYLLKHYPAWCNKVVFTQIAPPSRTDVHEYRIMRQQVENLAGHINGSYADFDWSPVRYLNRGYRRSTLLGFLRHSHVGLVTPLRDGMNLVAKEYVAAQPPDDPGVLVLSRFAGAAAELQDALIVNPYDIEGVGETLARALDMPLAERRRRWERLYEHLERHHLPAWRMAYL